MSTRTGFKREGSSTNQKITKVLSGSDKITKTGTNTLILDALNTFTGSPINILAGTLQLGQGVVSGNIVPATTPININAGTTLNYFAAANAVTHTGAITGTGNMIVTNVGPNVLFINGSMNTFAGTVACGRLTLANTVASSSLAAYTVTSPGNLSGNTTTTYNLGSLSGNGNVLAGVSGSATWSIGGLNTSTTFSGNISVAATSNNLIKVGTGTLTLTGTNTMNGTITISAGTLQLGNFSATNNVPAATNISIPVATATLATSYVANVTHTGTISGAGILTDSSLAGRFIIGGTMSAFTGTVNAGRIQLTSTASSSASAIYNVTSPGSINAGTATTFNLGALSGSGSLTDALGAGTVVWSIGAKNTNTTFSGSITPTTTNNLIKVGTGTLTMTGDNTALNGTVTVNAGTLSLARPSANTIPANKNVAINGTALLDFGSPSGTVTHSGNLTIASNGSIQKSGAGTLILSGTNTVPTTGFMIVNGGTLTVSNANALGTGATNGDLVLNAGATLNMTVNIPITNQRNVLDNVGSVTNLNGFPCPGLVFFGGGGVVNP